MQIVPFTSDYNQRLITQLVDKKYVFDARWNERGKIWTVDVSRDEDQVLLVAGVPLLSGHDVLAPYALGIGGLIPSDLGLKDSDAGPDDLGDRVIVAHVSVDELAVLRALQRSAGLPQTIPASGAPPTASGGSGGGAGGGSGPAQTIVQNVSVTNTFNTITVLGGLGFGFDDKYDDASGNEVLVDYFPQNPGLNPNPTVSLSIGFLASGTGGIRFYVDGSGTIEAVGSVGAPAGTLVGTAVGVAGAEAIHWFNQTIANPGGTALVKVTMKSSAPATNLMIRKLVGAMA